MHVVFGPDMQNDMDKVIRDKCKTQDQISECQQEINKLLQDSSLSTHSKRFLPIIAAATVAEIVNTLVAAIVAALGGLAIGAGINAATAPDSVNFEDTSQDGVLAQIKSLSDASTIAIATGTANEIMGTFTVSTTISTATPEPDKVCHSHQIPFKSVILSGSLKY
jgi:hypothetical protein